MLISLRTSKAEPQGTNSNGAKKEPPNLDLQNPQGPVYTAQPLTCHHPSRTHLDRHTLNKAHLHTPVNTCSHLKHSGLVPRPTSTYTNTASCRSVHSHPSEKQHRPKRSRQTLKMHIPTYTGDTPSEFTLSCYTETCFIKRKQLQCHPGLHEDTLRYMYADTQIRSTTSSECRHT